jgi:signal transduction histidine kinase
MSSMPDDLERECVRRLRRHLEGASESTRLSAYELGRSALAGGTGVLDMGALLLRSMTRVLGVNGAAGRYPATHEALESFALEALSPFEMAHRGAREANLALRRMDEIREDEIRRVAHELHDSAGQILATVHLALDDLARDLDPSSKPGLERVQVLLVRVEEQLRRLSHEFLPPMLDDLGLVPALQHLADGIARRTGLRISVGAELEQRLPPRFEVALYRVLQEALSNVARHASAHHASVTIVPTDSGVSCVIEDDGVGFDPASLDSPGEGAGLGLRGIRERASRLGGSFELRSSPGRGARLAISLPLEVGYAAARADRG